MPFMRAYIKYIRALEAEACAETGFMPQLNEFETVPCQLFSPPRRGENAFPRDFDGSEL